MSQISIRSYCIHVCVWICVGNDKEVKCLRSKDPLQLQVCLLLRVSACSTSHPGVRNIPSTKSNCYLCFCTSSIWDPTVFNPSFCSNISQLMNYVGFATWFSIGAAVRQLLFLGNTQIHQDMNLQFFSLWLFMSRKAQKDEYLKLRYFILTRCFAFPGYDGSVQIWNGQSGWDSLILSPSPLNLLGFQYYKAHHHDWSQVPIVLPIIYLVMTLGITM